MTPVPLPVSSPAPPQSPPVASRPGGPSLKAPAGPTSAMTHAAVRTGAPPAPSTKGSPGFARVLAAAQEQEEPGGALPEEGAGLIPIDRRLQTDGEATEPLTRADTADRAVAAQEPPPQGPAPTPWLLLSLSSGAGWTGAGEMSAEPTSQDGQGLVATAAVPVVGWTVARLPALAGEHGVSDSAGDAAGVATRLGATAGVADVDTPWLAVVSPDAQAGRTAVHRADALDEVLVGAEGVELSTTPVAAPQGAPAPPATGLSPEADIARPDRPTALAPASNAATVVPALPADTAFSPDTGRAISEPLSVPEVTPDVATAAAARAQTLDGTARWRAAARGTGGYVEVRPPAVTHQPAAAPTLSPPGSAARQLAQMLHQAQAGDSTAPSPPDAVQAGPAQSPGGPLPSARAGEVLMRLVQGGRGARIQWDGTPAPAAFAPLLATAAAMTPPTETPPPPAPAALAPAVGDQVMQQVLSSLRMQSRNGVGEARLQLRPDALGAVSVTLRVENGAVTAVVRADSPQVQEWVLQHQHTLRQQMEAAGLRLDELVVAPDDQRQSGGEEPAPEQQRRRPRAPANATRGDSPRFEQLL